MIKIKSTHLFFLLAITTLTSCSTLKPITPTPSLHMSWEEREASLQNLQSWYVEGKLSVKTASDSGSASVTWIQAKSKYRITLLGPFGTGGFILTGSKNQVNLQTSTGKNVSSTSPEQLLKEQWGFNVPVSNLRYWIRGLPVPGIKADTRFDRDGRLSRLSQDGWTVDFLSYSRVASMDLPQKISIHSSELNVKIMIYDWKR